MTKFSTEFEEAAKIWPIHGSLPVKVPFASLRTIFGLGDSRYVEDPDITNMFVNYLNFNFFKKSPESKACYLYPEETFSFNLFENDKDVQRVKSSALIATSRYKTVFGNEAMGFLIRTRIDSRKDIANPVIFGMTGLVRDGDLLEVKKLYLPLFDNNRLIGLNRSAVTPDSVNTALNYADLSIDQMFNYNMRPDFEANLKDAARIAAQGQAASPGIQADAPRL